MTVHEHRHQAILDDGGDGGGKAHRRGDNLVAWLQRAFQAAGAKSGHSDQVGRGTGVNRQSTAHAGVLRQPLLERCGAGAGGEPEIQHCIHGGDQFSLVVHPTGVVDPCLAGDEGVEGMGRTVVLRDERVDLFS